MAGFGVVIETYHVSPVRNPSFMQQRLLGGKFASSQWAVLIRRTVNLAKVRAKVSVVQNKQKHLNVDFLRS
jgi:hypothetical protein